MAHDTLPPAPPLVDGATYIYALIDPFTGAVRYVGKSERPEGRLCDHCNDRSRCHRTNWIRAVLREGGRPVLRLLEAVADGGDWREAERRWIAHGRASGWPLTNSTDGGDGVPGLPPESRERIAKAWVGRKHRPDSLEKIGDASRGRRHTPEHKARMSRLMAGRPCTWVRKVGEAVKKLTPEQVREVRRQLAAGAKMAHLARSLGVHPATIANIRDGRFYAEVV